MGSTNQGLHPLTPRYADLLQALPPDRVEIKVRTDGLVSVNGWADLDTLNTLLTGLGRRSDRPQGPR